MTEKEQIEEMARIIAFDLCSERHIHAIYGEEAQCYSDNNFAECTKIKNVVDKLYYNAGYRKIPKNAVVLTKEEFEELKQAKILLSFREETIKYLEDANIRYSEALENVRKWQKRFFGELGNISVGGLTVKLKNYMQFKDICKKYGIEVKK